MTNRPTDNRIPQEEAAVEVEAEASTLEVTERQTAAEAAPAPAKRAASLLTPKANVTVIPDPDDPDMVIIRTRKRKRKKDSSKKMNPKLRVLLIVLAVIVGLLAAVGIALAIAVNVGNVNLHKVFGGLEDVPAEVVSENQGQTIEYDGHTYRYNENVVSFLLIGRDDESNIPNLTRPDASCADVDVLFTLDTSNNKMNAIVIPRNSWVPVDLYDENETYVATRDMQLTLAHAVLLDTISECAANTTKSVSYLFYNLPITYYVDIDQKVVKDASSAIGGVPVEVLESIPGEQYSVGDDVVLSGDSAYRYVNYRNTDEFESALARQERQVQFVKAFAAKLKSLNPQDIVNLYTSVSGDVVSNLGLPELTYLASCFVAGDNAELNITSLSGVTEVVAESDGIEYERYYLDKESIVRNMLDAYYTELN